MNYRDLAIEFTESHYLTKSQVIEYYSNSYNELIWVEICRYRHVFSKVIELDCENGSNLFFISHSKLNQKLEALTRKTLLLSTLFNETSYDSSFFYKHKKYFSHVVFEEVFALLKAYRIDITLNTLVKLVGGVERPKGSNEAFSRNLFLLLYRIAFKKKQEEKVTLESLQKISSRLGNKNLIRKDFWFLDEANLIVAGFDPNILEEKLKVLLKFIYKKTFSFHPLIKAIAVFYYFKFGIFSEKNVDLIAVYLMLHTLKVSNYKGIVLTIPLIKAICDNSKSFDNAYWDSTESNNDITYLIHTFVDIATKEVDRIISSFEKNSEDIQRFREVSEEKRNTKIKLDPILTTFGKDKSIQEIKSLGLHNKEQLFLKHVKNDDKEYYSLNDFKNITHSSYEKARYSMNNFCKEGYFTKHRKGKKFIFSPNRETF